MNEEYLWDRSGPVDPDVAELEALLGALQYRPPRRTTRWRWIVGLTAAAASVVLWFALDGAPSAARRSYEVAGLAGRDRAFEGEELRVADRPASLTIGDIGQVVVEPGARLELIDCGSARHHLHLSIGALTARITPDGAGRFQVGTPAGLSVDLGCIYRVEVRPDGGTRVSVSFGMVSFEGADGRRVWVPTGAECRARPGRGAGAPHPSDVDDAYRDAVERVQFDPTPHPVDLDRVFGARMKKMVKLAPQIPSTELTLWHLLRATSAVARERAFEALDSLVAPPDGVTQEGVLAGDERMIDAWRTRLDF